MQSSVGAYEQGCGLGRYAFRAPCKAEALGGGGLYAHAAGLEAEVGRHACLHGGDVRQQAGFLCHYGDVDVGRAVALCGGHGRYFAQQHARVGAFPARG